MQKPDNIFKLIRKTDKTFKGNKDNMCKIMAFAGIKPDKVKAAWKFAQVASGRMMTGGEKDGFGYAYINAIGEVAGERWVKPEDVFKNRYVPTAEEKRLLDSYQGGLLRPVEYDSFGAGDPENVTAMILHSRLATSAKGLHNTHPFVRDNTCMIHNGVISNVRELSFYTSTCDSEGILNSYVDNDVGASPKMIEQVAAELVGSYAVAILGTLPDGTPYMDIFKNDRTQLIAAFVAELGTLVFSTNMWQLEQTCNELKYNITSAFMVEQGKLMRIHAETGEVISVTGFDIDIRYKKPSQGSGNTTSHKTTELTSNRTASSTTSTTSDAEFDESFTEEQVAELLKKEFARADRDNPNSPYHVGNVN